MEARILSEIEKDELGTEPVAQAETTEAVEYTEEKFLKDLLWTSRAYLIIVIASAIIAAAGIAVAVIVKVSYGLAIAIAAVLAYALATEYVLQGKLGVSYTSGSGELIITECFGKKRDQIWIPRRLLWLGVTEIKDEAFDHKSSAYIKTVHLPATLKKIGKDAFKSCDALEKICFEGSEAQWAQVICESALDGIELCFGDTSGYPARDESARSERKNKRREKKIEKIKKKKDKEATALESLEAIQTVATKDDASL